MQIIEIKELFEELYKVYGNDWQDIARQIQIKGYYQEMDIRSLADKIRKPKTCGALRNPDVRMAAPSVESDKTESAFSPTITVNADGTRTVTKLARLKNAENLSKKRSAGNRRF